MPSSLQIKVHINRALRARAVEQKLDEIAIALNELARYVEELEKESLSRAAPNTNTPKALRAPAGGYGARMQSSRLKRCSESEQRGTHLHFQHEPSWYAVLSPRGYRTSVRS
jgi:hypothetical protein